MIPKIIHFIYGLDANFSNKPFCFFHYLSVLSAKHLNKCEVFLHFKYEPENNIWWEKTKLLTIIRKIDYIPSEICGKKIIFPEHSCDFLRLSILKEYGGIYLDIDTICNKPFDDLLGHECVMGIETFKGEVNGLCNAVILAVPNNKFIQLWLDEYSYFDPNDWNLMAVRTPFKLSKKHPELIHVVDEYSFFKFDWHTIIGIFNGDECACDGYVIHLWESKIYHPILKHITRESIYETDSLFNTISRRYL